MNQVLQKVADFYGYSEAEIAEAILSLFEEI